MPDEPKNPASTEAPMKDHSAAPDDAQSPKPILNMISSSISGPGIGDDVAAKRANLLNEGAHGDPHLGRRPTPDPYDPRPTRLMYAKGLLAGAAVIVIVFIILVVVGSMNPVA